MAAMTGKKIAIFVGDLYEDMELQYPKYRLLEADAQIVLIGLEANRTCHGKHTYPQTSDASIDQVEPGDFDGLVIPGGWMPDKLRREDRIKQFTRAMDEAGRCIASICHGPWIDISAGIVQGRTYTSTPALKDDLTNAGATWVNQPLCVEGNRVSSRRPDDLPLFMQGVFQVMGVEAAAVA